MNKILRYSFVAVMAMMGFGNAMAEDVIWSEDWTGWTEKIDPNTDPQKPDNYNFTGTTFKDDGSYKGGTGIYNEKLAGGEAPELLVAKNGGTFVVSVNLGGKSGDMTLAFKCNKNIPVEVSGGTIGENAGSGNDYVYAIAGVSGSLTITFNNTTSANARLDDIKLFIGQGKKPAGLSWGTSSRTVTIGADDNIFPKLSNENNLSVTYKSSETGVATIDAEGNITLVAAGETVISAESAETDEFEAGKAEYKLTVKEAGGGGGDQPGVTEITVAKALEIIAGLADGAKTDEEYKVTGYVVTVTEISTQYGNATFTIADEKGGSSVLTIFRAKDANGDNITDENFVKVDDLIVAQGKLQKYVKDGVTTPEMAQGGRILSVNQGTGVNTIEVNKSNNAAVYNLAGQRVNQNYKGLVIKNGKKVVVK